MSPAVFHSSCLCWGSQFQMFMLECVNLQLGCPCDEVRDPRLPESLGLPPFHSPAWRQPAVWSHFRCDLPQEGTPPESGDTEREESNTCVHMHMLILCVHYSLRPPLCRQPQQPLSSTNFLHELDKVTQDILTVGSFFIWFSSYRYSFFFFFSGHLLFFLSFQLAYDISKRFICSQK